MITAAITLLAACGYVVIAGLVAEVLRARLNDEVLEGLAAVFWPIVPLVAFVAILLKTLAVHLPRAIVTSVRRWRSRARVPSARTVRR